MAKSQETFNKKEKEKKRLKKRQEKLARREERKSQPKDSFEDMIAYVDEHGNITDTPPDPTIKKQKINADLIEISIPKKGTNPLSSMRTGKIDFFNEQKGFGFIKETNSVEKYFVHVHGLIDEVHEGDLVSFELERGVKGMNAVQVRKVEPEEKSEPTEEN